MHNLILLPNTEIRTYSAMNEKSKVKDKRYYTSITYALMFIIKLEIFRETNILHLKKNHILPTFKILSER
jgi:hypothetical protein